MVTGQNGSGQNGTDKLVWTNQNVTRTKWYTDKMVYGQNGIRTKWYTDKMVYGQNGIRTKWYMDKMVYGQIGMDKPKWYTDKMVYGQNGIRTKWYMDKMVYGQNGTILYFEYILIQLNSIYISKRKSQINEKHIEE